MFGSHVCAARNNYITVMFGYWPQISVLSAYQALDVAWRNNFVIFAKEIESAAKGDCGQLKNIRWFELWQTKIEAEEISRAEVFSWGHNEHSCITGKISLRFKIYVVSKLHFQQRLDAFVRWPILWNFIPLGPQNFLVCAIYLHYPNIFWGVGRKTF